MSTARVGEGPGNPDTKTKRLGLCVGLCVGASAIAVVPPELGYGAKGSLPSVPPKADLRFDVELLEVGAGFAV